MKAADALIGGLVSRNHRRAAKKRARAIEYARDRPNRIQLYRELIKVPGTLAYADQATTAAMARVGPDRRRAVASRVRHYRPLIERIVAQTERRVLHGEAIAANEKIVSLFEPHADIIVKGGREVQYGHKLNLTTGRSGLILDLVIEPSNPADSERFLPMLKRHIAFYGQAPDRPPPTAVSPAMTISAGEGPWRMRLGLPQEGGLRIKDMVKSNWVYRKLRNFRAGVESDISCSKRAYGLARCVWRGLDHFRAYVWS